MSTCIYTNIYVKMDIFLYLHVDIKIAYLVSVGLNSYKGTTAMCIK